jgi:hypothetical protein
MRLKEYFESFNEIMIGEKFTVFNIKKMKKRKQVKITSGANTKHCGLQNPKMKV